MKLLGTYRNGNYNVSIYEDGTKVRFTKDDEFKPSFAENCDVKITDKCSVGCAFCYEGCLPTGFHADLNNSGIDRILDSLHPWTEFALNGNDMDHPQLEDFLKKLKERNILANITVNIDQFLDNFDKIEQYKRDRLINGIGVSYTNRNITAIEKSKLLEDVVFHTIAGVTDHYMYDELVDNKCKILILGYKDIRRGESWKEWNYHLYRYNMNWLKEHVDFIMKTAQVTSFDNLALEQLDVKSHLSEKEWERFYMGDDGSFTFYIDLVKMEYAKNSLATERFPIENKTIDEMFQHILTLKQ